MPTPTKQPLSTIEEKTPKPSILIVDDDATVREFLAEVLLDSGFPVTEGTDGNSAMKVIEGRRVDLVITDLVMPDRDGLEIISWLKREHPAVKIIAISGYHDGAYLYHAARFGAHATINKPLSIERFLQMVYSVLDLEPPGRAASEPQPASGRTPIAKLI
jgi:DNA-binding NtrC family response regulator